MSYDEWAAIRPGTILRLEDEGGSDTSDLLFMALAPATMQEHEIYIEAWNMSNNTKYEICFGEKFWTWFIVSEP